MKRADIRNFNDQVWVDADGRIAERLASNIIEQLRGASVADALTALLLAKNRLTKISHVSKSA